MTEQTPEQKRQALAEKFVAHMAELDILGKQADEATRKLADQQASTERIKQELRQTVGSNITDRVFLASGFAVHVHYETKDGRPDAKVSIHRLEPTK